MLDNRHLVLRGETASSVMKVRAAVELAFVDAFAKLDFTKVSPPAIVQGEVEGGSSLFKCECGHKPYIQQLNGSY
jgi:asparaginyl-tRNA synthetase